MAFIRVGSTLCKSRNTNNVGRRAVGIKPQSLEAVRRMGVAGWWFLPGYVKEKNQEKMRLRNWFVYEFLSAAGLLPDKAIESLLQVFVAWLKFSAHSLASQGGFPGIMRPLSLGAGSILPSEAQEDVLKASLHTHALGCGRRQYLCATGGSAGLVPLPLPSWVNKRTITRTASGCAPLTHMLATEPRHTAFSHSIRKQISSTAETEVLD